MVVLIGQICGLRGAPRRIRGEPHQGRLVRDVADATDWPDLHGQRLIRCEVQRVIRYADSAIKMCVDG